MRTLLLILFGSAAPAALMAAPITVPATVTAVTIFPQGAQARREAQVPAAGEVLIPDLPAGADMAGLRVTGEGLTIGAATLISGRAGPEAGAPDTPAVAAARAEVTRLTEVLAEKQDAVAQIRAGAEAARARIDFLTHLSGAEARPDDLTALTDAVGEGVASARKDQIAAEAAARVAEAALVPDEAALERARKALDALEHPAAEGKSLLLQVSGPGKVVVTTQIADAGWSAAYDLRLDADGAKLMVDRFADLRQASGEDWRDVALTLSTARPAERTDPPELPPERVHSGPPGAPAPMAMARKLDLVAASDAADFSPAATAVPEIEGETVVYRYPTPVDIRDGVDGLRLSLDSLGYPVRTLAEATPRLGPTVWRVVEGVDTGAEPLLPGPAALYVDGALVGLGAVPFVAAGDAFRIGFGAIDGMRATRITPEASEGDRGLITKSNERVETARLRVENLTSRAWPVRLIDRAPYSEQDDLKATWKADPAPTATDWQDRRGVLTWEFTLQPGASRDAMLTTTLNWPAGEVLQ